MERLWIALGGLLGAGTVAMAAVAAHALSHLDPVAVQQVRSAVQMQGWHALALLAAGLWAPRGGALAHLAGAAFALGSVLFCGAVYALALDGRAGCHRRTRRWACADRGMAAAWRIGRLGGAAPSPVRHDLAHQD
jgi:uncharacterized membrane protein YgdD (TMEM256/DUF423 family)